MNDLRSYDSEGEQVFDDFLESAVFTSGLR